MTEHSEVLSNETFLSQLQSIIGKTLRQIQLHTGHMKEVLRIVCKWLNMARKSLYEGKRLLAESEFRIALNCLRMGKQQSCAGASLLRAQGT